MAAFIWETMWELNRAAFKRFVLIRFISATPWIIPRIGGSLTEAGVGEARLPRSCGVRADAEYSGRSGSLWGRKGCRLSLEESIVCAEDQKPENAQSKRKL